MRVKCELNIALTDDAKMTNGPNRNGPQQLVLLVIERLRWRDHDGFAGVNTHRVQVFHVAHGYAIVAAVANQLVFDLLPAAEILLGQHLLHAPGEPPPQRVFELGLCTDHATALASQGISGAQHHRKADLVGGRPRFFKGVARPTPSGGHIDFA